MRCAILIIGLLLAACSPASGREPTDVGSKDGLVFRPVLGVASVTPATSPTPTPSPAPTATPTTSATPKATPIPIERPSKVLRGEASWGYGFKGNVVTRYPRGTHIRVCGPLGCTGVVHSWGYGPAKYTGRIADIDVNVFENVCGPRSIGICNIRLEVWQ